LLSLRWTIRLATAWCRQTTRVEWSGLSRNRPWGRPPPIGSNAGTYVLEPSVLDRIATDRKVSIERETFPAMVSDQSLWSLNSDRYWVDAGTPSTYLQVQLDLIDGLRGTVVPGVSLDAKVASDAMVEHSVVMAGATIESGSAVRDSVVLPGATIGRGAQVTDSLVGPRARIGERATVELMSVVGDNVEVAGDSLVSGSRVPEVV